jgi:hypothetical protein
MSKENGRKFKRQWEQGTLALQTLIKTLKFERKLQWKFNMVYFKFRISFLGIQVRKYGNPLVAVFSGFPNSRYFQFSSLLQRFAKKRHFYP